jgi:hypothetical protein
MKQNKLYNVLIVKATVAFTASLAMLVLYGFISNWLFSFYHTDRQIVWLALWFIITVIVAKASAIGNPFFRSFSFGDGWHHNAHYLPDMWCKGKNLIDVIFITESCQVFNGVYDTECEMFVSVDGVYFDKKDICLWRYEKDLLPFVDRENNRFIY